MVLNCLPLLVEAEKTIWSMLEVSFAPHQQRERQRGTQPLLEGCKILFLNQETKEIDKTLRQHSISKRLRIRDGTFKMRWVSPIENFELWKRVGFAIGTKLDNLWNKFFFFFFVSYIFQFYSIFKQKSTLLASNTLGLRTIKQTTPRPVTCVRWNSTSPVEGLLVGLPYSRKRPSKYYRGYNEKFGLFRTVWKP